MNLGSLGRDGRVLAICEVAAISAGGAAYFGVSPAVGEAVWAAAAVAAVAPTGVSAARTLARGRIGVDIIAFVAIVAALALGEYLTAAIVGLMLSGGVALERGAARRARADLAQLVARMPVSAWRRVGDRVEEVPVDVVVPGDAIVVRAGEIVPVDGELADDEAILDEAALTGEPLPVIHARGDALRSGTTNAGQVFDLRASRRADDSAYAAVVRVVREAEGGRAPFVRLADRWAAVLLPLTLVVAGGAWLASGDSTRALAVLVVATPCPLILAAPIALVCGVSRAARHGIIAKGSGPIEQMGRARTILMDKTGTLTLGAPSVGAIDQLDSVDPTEMLRLVASVEQFSTNVVARSVVSVARSRGLALSAATDVCEGAGMGIEGVVDGRRVTAGSPRWLAMRGYTQPLPGADGGRVLVGIDHHLAGVLTLDDPVRDDAQAAIVRLRALGVDTIAILTGDSAATAERIGGVLGIDRVYADLTPQAKAEIVRAVGQRPGSRPVVMVGDGINDAPALAVADVGIAMASGGATVSSETADIVITSNTFDRVVDAVEIGRRSLGIARQSVAVGMGLSVVAMGVAAFGYLPPIAGALLQEAIDVTVILNALRARRG